MTNVPPPKPFDESYWVIPGQLLAGQYPDAMVPAFTHLRLTNLLGLGVRAFVDLTEQGERDAYMGQVKKLLQEDDSADYQRFPIRDRDVPRPETMTAILDYIDARLAEGKPVYLHCWGGIGRTGTVVGCYLVRHGFTPRQALARIAELRQGLPSGMYPSPETPEQVEFIQNWQASK